MVGPERVIENKSVSHGFLYIPRGQSAMMLVGNSPIFAFWLKVGYQAYTCTKICTHLCDNRYRMGTNIIIKTREGRTTPNYNDASLNVSGEWALNDTTVASALIVSR